MGTPLQLHFTCTTLAGINKGGEIERDEEGYYKVLLGALNVRNHSDIKYIYRGCEHVFHESSTFMRKVRNGNLFGEEDHPPWEPGMSQAEFEARNEWIETKNVAFHIKDVFVEVTEEFFEGLPVVEIWGWIKPDRARGPLLQAALDNPSENVCFSLRAFVDERRLPDGTKTRVLLELITFDWVIEDGLKRANKFSSIVSNAKIARESVMRKIGQECTKEFTDIPLTESLLNQLANMDKSASGVHMATESARLQTAERARGYLAKVQTKPKVKLCGLGTVKF